MHRLKIIYITLLILVSALYSCNQKDKQEFNPELDPLISLTQPIILKPGINQINLGNFIENDKNIDSVFFSEEGYTFDSNTKILEISHEFEQLPNISTIDIAVNGNTYSIVCLKSPKIDVNINYTPQSDITINSVSIAGDFNSWNPNTHPLKFADGIWTTNLSLDKGLYQYQLVVDGKWQNNYPEGDTVANGIGGYNTVLIAKNACSTNPLSLTTIDHNEDEIIIGTNHIPNQLCILWQNQIINTDLNKFKDNKYTIKIPEKAKDLDKSYIRVYSSHNTCLSNDLLIPLKNGKVVTSTKELSRSDKHLNIMYFVLVDRFFNGNEENDNPVNDPRVHYKSNYQGGDLHGIKQKLDEGYFEDLGINCLWISPIFQNPQTAFQEFPEPRRYFSGYHGYWPTSSTEIDRRFGDDLTFTNLVNTAHSKNMNVILDFVANHVHQEHQLYQDNKDWATELHLDDGELNIRIWDDQRLTTWFDTFLPSWDFENPEVTDTISELAIYWIKKFDLDGFRHDATKHIPEIFWETLTKKLSQNFKNKSIYQIGETFGSRELIGNYVGSDKLDGQFDFNLYFDSRNCFADSLCNMQNIAESLIASLSYYGYHNLMGNITGNHDLIRFISYADKSVFPGEDDKEAGWSRDITVQNGTSYKKLTNLAAFTLSIPGVPCIYYGDEIGMPGVGDPDNRRMMNFDKLNENETKTFETFKKLIDIRKNNIEFIYGTTNIIDAGNNTLVLKRQYFGHVSYLIINQSGQETCISINKNETGDIASYTIHFDSEINELNSSYQFMLAPYSFEILTKK
ncbi:MAG: hypothetical protein JXR36_13515 [Bacteroidales bacterium]|nr:hypothetical protein [Bacteroidales bacterium]